MVRIDTVQCALLREGALGARGGVVRLAFVQACVRLNNRHHQLHRLCFGAVTMVDGLTVEGVGGTGWGTGYMGFWAGGPSGFKSTLIL
jgi:hypothetical protein